ncbi:MAG: MBL fold metallo-hydrolase [Actinobacteria bacterium]|nr:MBL fold metallo-hydrolase [Actinomycetota bacterium]
MTDLFELSDRLLSGSSSMSGHNPLSLATGARLQPVTDNIAFIEAFGNVIGVRDGGEFGIVDAGGPLHAQAVVDSARGWTDNPLRSAVFTHGHVDHIAAVKLFEAEGHGPARVLAHEAVPRRFARYELTRGYNGVINQRQFQLAGPYFPGEYRYPDETYSDAATMHVGSIELALRHDRGETDDGTWVWIPSDKVLCTGDLFIWASPNCGNPQKAQRYCDEWAAALRKMADLGAEFMLPGHGLPIAGADRIRSVLLDTARYLETIFDQTIEMMNAGARLTDIVATVRPPADLEDRPWLQPVYDEPEFVVRGIWRLYGGWYDGNPAHLKPASDRAFSVELAALAGGVERLVERALELCDASGDTERDTDLRLAAHLIEMASQAEPDSVEVRRARATVFGKRAEVERSTMAKGVFSWAVKESADPIE